MGRPEWEKLLKFRCTGCGNCCKETFICVTDADVRRLADGLKRPVESFIRFAREGEFVFGKRHGWWIKFARRQAVMILRWKNRRCIFLDDEDRCTAYAYRPLVCRSHPFEVTLTGEDTGGIEDIKLMKLTPCPHELDGHHTRREIGLLERLHWRESARYVDLVKRWNKRRSGRNPAAFLREVLATGRVVDTPRRAADAT